MVIRQLFVKSRVWYLFANTLISKGMEISGISFDFLPFHCTSNTLLGKQVHFPSSFSPIRAFRL